MNAVEAAARLGVHETQVTEVREHAAGWLVSLRRGPVMLVTDQVARVYVPEVDDVATGGVVENPPVVGEDGPPPLVVPKKATKAAVKATKKAAPGV